MKSLSVFIGILLVIPVSTYGQTAVDIAKMSINSIVSIVTLDNISQPLGHGSGFIIDNETIVTNVHVIEGSSSAYVLLNGQTKKYQVNGYVAIDRANDLVILKVSGISGGKLPLGSENLPDIGERIYAVGNPKGLTGTFTEGIISGIREISTSQVLQITAPISPGSSGGAVLNSTGQVIGIAFASFKDGQSLNFAIPVKYLIKLKNQIGAIASLTNVKKQTSQATAQSISPNIKDGVILRNVEFEGSYSSAYIGLKSLNFSIKNNLPYTVSDIQILFLLYDTTGTVVDYKEIIYCKTKYYVYGIIEKDGIKPFLARNVSMGSQEMQPEFFTKPGYKVRYRILDFKINEE